jgi:hypothetical protein
MDEYLNESDFDVIIDSLNHYKMNIENYGEYPSYELKQKQLERVGSAIRKVKDLETKLGVRQGDVEISGGTMA